MKAIFTFVITVTTMYCNECQTNVPDEALAILKHLRDFHPDEKDLNVQCPECPKKFKSEPSFRKHHYTNHHAQKRKKPPFPDPAIQCPIPVKKVSDSEASRAISVQSVSESSLVEDAYQDQTDSGEGTSRNMESGAGFLCVHEFQTDHSAEESNVNVESGGSILFCEDRHQTDFLNLEEKSENVDGSEIEAQTESCLNSSSISESTGLLSYDADDNGDESESADSESVLSTSDSDESEGDLVQEICEEVQPCSSNSASQPASQIITNKGAASFLFHLKDKCVVPDNSIKEVLENTESLIRSSLQDFSKQINENLASKGVSLNSVMNVDSAINSSTAAVFNNIRTVTQQDKFFKEEYGVVEPIRIPLGREFKRVRRTRKVKMQTTIVAEEIMYVPLDDNMDKLINHPDYKRFVEEGSSNSSSSVLDSYMKGEKCKKNPILKEHPDALRFVLYYDDLEVCCPLKSKAGKNKIGAFYLHLDNIPLKYRSNLNLICVVALVNANLVKGTRYGMDSGLEKLVKILQKFEDGIILKSGKKVYGTLIATIGDNLGAHQVGGFKEGFTAHRSCRFCYATRSQIQNMTSEDAVLMRDEESHARQCAEVQTEKGKNDAKSKEYGVNRDSLLNILRSYHVCGGLPPDIMHDEAEGWLPLTVKRFLRYHLYEKTGQKLFTLDWINKAVRDFDFDYSEISDKPSELKKDYIMDDQAGLHQSACQMLLLAAILPLIVGPLIDTEDKHFQNLLDALEIVRITFSNVISIWMVSYLKDLIQEYLSNFISLYGPLIPKQHHLVHYPSQILLYGPLINFMCMRSEAKHKYFKRLVNMLGTFKNVSWSLCRRHQFSQAAAWQKTLRKEAKCGPFRYLSTAEVSYNPLLPNGVLKVVETNWLEYHGLKFVPNQCYICVGVEPSDYRPVFLKVVKVIIFPEIEFVCQKVLTTKKNIHLAAYEVHLLSEYCIVKPEQMTIPKVLHVHSAQNKSYLILRQCVADALF